MDINDLIRFLPDRIKAAGKSNIEVAEESGLGDRAIYDILGGRSKNPRYSTLQAIAKTLGCSVDDLYADPYHLAPLEDEPVHPALPNYATGSTAEHPVRMERMERDLPVIGQAKAGYTGIFMGNGEVIAHIDRPPMLVGVVGAFAVYVRGESMEPRYFDGELLYVHPHKPVRAGDFALIELHNQEAFVKRFRTRNNDFVVAEQYNPASRIDYVADTVKHVYRVVGSTEDA